MITLERLIRIGAIASSLQEVPIAGVRYETAVSVSSMSEEEQKSMHSIVTVDAPEWIATSKGRPAQEAATVYSCNGKNEIGCWKSKQRTFLQMELSGTQLQTTRQMRLKEEEKMAKLDDMNDQLKDLDVFEAELGKVSTPQALAGGAAPAAEEKKISKADEEAREIEELRSSLNGVKIANRDDIIVANRMHGRLIAFVTGTNNVVRISKKRVPVLDANGRRQLKPGHDLKPDELKKHAEKGNYPLKACITEKELGFVDAKPSKPIGIIVATPASSEAKVTNMHSDEELKVDESKTDMQYRILPMEVAEVYVAMNYGGAIREDERVLGPLASKILQKYTRSRKQDPKTGQMIEKMRSSFVLDKEDQKRSTLLVTGNYFPLKVYKTIDVANATEEEIKILNHNFEAMLRNNEEYESLTEESRKNVRRDENGICTSEYFNNKKPIEVLKFDKMHDQDVVTDVRVAAREVGTTKEGKPRYTFIYDKVGEENGPDTIPVFNKIIENSHINRDDFIAQVKKLGVRSGGSARKRVALTSDDFLKTIGSSIDNGISKSLSQIQEEIFGM